MSIYQVAVKAVMDSSEDYRNIHHYEFFGYVPDDTQLQEFVDGIDSAYKTYLQASIHSGLEVVAYDVRRVDIGDQPTIEYVATGGSWNGTASGAPLPFQIAALVTFKALAAFPRTTRTYMFPSSVNAVTSVGNIGSGTVTALENWGNAMLEIAITGALNADKQAVQYGGTPRTVTDANDVTIVMANPIWATQRRRRRGVGI